jgi:hypothetical protein
MYWWYDRDLSLPLPHPSGNSMDDRLSTSFPIDEQNRIIQIFKTFNFGHQLDYRFLTLAIALLILAIAVAGVGSPTVANVGIPTAIAFYTVQSFCSIGIESSAYLNSPNPKQGI